MNFGLKNKEFPSYYIWSNGSVTNLSGHSLAILKGRYGYMTAHLSHKGKAVKKLVHRLVMEAFRGSSKLHVNHLDGDKSNNHISNLEYVTAQENVDHAIRTGLINVVGENNGNSKLTAKDVVAIRKLISQGIHKKEIAQKFNIALGYVYQLRDKGWSHL